MLEELQQLQAVGDGEGFAGPLGLGVEATDDVGVVGAGEGGDRVERTDLRVGEDLGVGDVALHDGDAMEAPSQFQRPFVIPLDDHHLGAALGERRGHQFGGAATSQQQHLASACGRAVPAAP